MKNPTTTGQKILKPAICLAGIAMLFLMILPGFAQQPLWKRFTTLDQLTDPNVMTMNRHPDGTIFLGTQNGIVAISGVNQQHYTTRFNGGNRINPFIHCIEFKGDYLYSGTRNSIWMVNRKNGKITTSIHRYMRQTGVTNISFSPDSSRIYASTIEGILIYDLMKDSLVLSEELPIINATKINFYKNDLYVYLGKKELIRLKNGKTEHLFPGEPIWDLQWMPAKKYWVCISNQGMKLFYPDGRKSELLPVNVNWENMTVNKTLMPGMNNTVFIRLTDGVLEIDPDLPSQSFFHRNEEDNPYTISSNTSDFVYSDPQQNTWYASSAIGLNYLEENASDILFLSNTSMNIKHFWSITRDKVSGLFFWGTDRGLLAGTITNSRFRLVKRIEDPSKPTFIVTAVIPYDHQHFLITSFGYGCFLLDKKTLILKELTQINRFFKTKNLFGASRLDSQTILIYSQAGSYVFKPAKKSIEPLKCDGKEIFEGNFNFCALKDSKQQLWVGSGGGILRCDRNFHKTGLFSSEARNLSSLSSNVVLNFLETRAGELYIATMGGGLCRYNEKNNSFATVKLCRDPVNIYGIIQPDDNSLVLTTSQGLCRYNMKTGESTQLNKDNLLPFNDFNQFSFYLDDEYFLAGGEKGLLIISRGKIRDVFSANEKVVLRQNGQIVNNLVLKTGNRTLDLYCSLLDDLPHKKINISYHLEGFEDNPHPLTAGNGQILYNYLPPGNYVLSIHAADSNNFSRIEPCSISITVKPYYYESGWFRLLMGVVVTALIILIVRYFALLRLRRKLRKLEDEQRISNERLRISRELHDNVGSQLTYLISGLEASEMMLKNNKISRLEDNIGNLQESARESIQQLRQAIWALSREEISCSALADQFHVWLNRMLGPHPAIQLKYNTAIENNAVLDPLKGLNIYRILQEAVNNVLKHADAGKLEISIHSDSQQFEIVIQDNGKGFDTDKAGGNGLMGMKHRARETEGILSVHSSPANGSRLTLTIPWL